MLCKNYIFLEIAHKSLNENGTIRLVFPDADLAYNAYKENRYNFFEIYESRINYSIPDDHKIEYLPNRPGERYASALTSMNLSNKVHKIFGKLNLENYIKNIKNW